MLPLQHLTDASATNKKADINCYVNEGDVRLLAGALCASGQSLLSDSNAREESNIVQAKQLREHQRSYIAELEC